MAKGKGKRKLGAGDVASNRYASHRYSLLERLECGIVLEGTEVKALRASGAQLKDGYAAVRDGVLVQLMGDERRRTRRAAAGEGGEGQHEHEERTREKSRS